jgi:signal transduction histidine kinase
MTDERTGSDTEQAQIAALQKQLVQTQRELEGFVYGVSHDLRAPLRSISGFSQAILDMTQSDAQLDPKLQHFLTRITQASHKLTEMIDGLLNVSRVARAEMHPRAVNVSQLCQESFDAIRARYPNREIAIDIQPGLTANADARLLRTAIDAIIDNACKFTAATPNAKIVVSAAETPHSFCIRDNGVGFDMQYIDKLFQPFQRLHNDPKYSGIGLGLATAQRILSRHQGSISIQASTQGTEVNLALPS